MAALRVAAGMTEAVYNRVAVATAVVCLVAVGCDKIADRAVCADSIAVDYKAAAVIALADRSSFPLLPT